MATAGEHIESLLITDWVGGERRQGGQGFVAKAGGQVLGEVRFSKVAESGPLNVVNKIGEGAGGVTFSEIVE